MEIRLRAIVLILVLAALLAASTAVIRLRQASLAGRQSLTPTPSATSTVPSVAVYDTRSITFKDESTRWEWRVDCEEALPIWLAQHPQITFTSLEVVLVDGQAQEDLRPGPGARELVLGAALPDPYHPQTVGIAGCAGEGNVRCYVAPERGGTGQDVDMVVTTAWAYALEDYFRDRGSPPPPWVWENYQPLIAKEGEGWLSACVSLSSSP